MLGWGLVQMLDYSLRASREATPEYLLGYDLIDWSSTAFLGHSNLQVAHSNLIQFGDWVALKKSTEVITEASACQPRMH